MFVSIKSRLSLKLGHVQMKTRSLGQIIKNPCQHSRGHIFCLIFINFCQNVCLHKIQAEVETGSSGVKNQVTRSNSRKTLLTLQRPHFQPHVHKTLSECLSPSNLYQSCSTYDLDLLTYFLITRPMAMKFELYLRFCFYTHSLCPPCNLS